jgi:membrane protein YdbS with pleckstrin-like domain
MIIIVMIAAQWYFFRQNTRYSMLSFLYLCLFIMVFALLMFFLYKIFKYLKDNEYICKTVQKKASELAQTWNR